MTTVDDAPPALKRMNWGDEIRKIREARQANSGAENQRGPRWTTRALVYCGQDGAVVVVRSNLAARLRHSNAARRRLLAWRASNKHRRQENATGHAASPST